MIFDIVLKILKNAIPMTILTTVERIKEQIESSPALLYMKGSPLFPQCGFSAQVAQILQTLKIDFNFVNILSEPDIRKEIPTYAQWPTFPQLWLNGELIGGCDIITEMFQSGELDTLLSENHITRNSEIKELK